MINIKNGMLDLKTLQVVPHSHKYKSLIQLPIEYDPQADHTFVDRFLSEVIPKDAIPVFWEYLASCLITDRYQPKAFALLVGPSDSGKSKMIEWITRLLGGKKNVLSHSLKSLADNDFMKHDLFGKLANAFSDLSDIEIENTGFIKTLSGDDMVTANRKHKDTVTFKNTARLFFSANNFPVVKNPDEAYFRRALIFKCENVFTDKTKDPLIVQKLTTPENMSATLNRMIEGLQRLKANREQLSHSPSIHAARIEYQEAIDSVAAFLADRTLEDAEAMIEKTKLYITYKNWCITRNRTPFNDNRFSRKIKEQAGKYNMVEARPTDDDGKQKWVWKGRMLLGAR